MRILKEQGFRGPVFILQKNGGFCLMSNVGRKRKKNGFTQVSNAMLEDTRLSWRAKGLLCYMLSRPDNWKINKTDLYKKATEGRDAMQKSLDELKKLGYLHIYAQKNEKGLIDTWIWEYDDVAFEPTILKNQITEKPQETGQNVSIFQTTEKPDSGESSVWNSSIYNNTDSNNTNNNNTKDKEIKTIKVTTSQLEKEFETVWALYPRKMGRKKAFDSFTKARKIKKIPYETIENGLYRYIRYLEQQGTDEQYILHGSTFFNQEKWKDEYTLTGLEQKPRNIKEYWQQKYGNGGNHYEPHGNREIIDCNPTVIPDLL